MRTSSLQHANIRSCRVNDRRTPASDGRSRQATSPCPQRRRRAAARRPRRRPAGAQRGRAGLRKDQRRRERGLAARTTHPPALHPGGTAPKSARTSRPLPLAANASVRTRTRVHARRGRGPLAEGRHGRVLATIALAAGAVTGSSGQRERLRCSRCRLSGCSELQAGGGGHHRHAPGVHSGDDLLGGRAANAARATRQPSPLSRSRSRSSSSPRV
jgi:hypothetical protein